MLEILQGQFFRGVIVGLILSFLGGWFQARISHNLSQKRQKAIVTIFYLDIIRNIKTIIDEMEITRTNANLIPDNYLVLINIEIAVYDRNREQIVHLSQSIRDDVRKFMTNTAIKRAEAVSNLDEFYKLTNQADFAKSEGQPDIEKETRNKALEPLERANKAADKLAVFSKDASQLMDKIENQS